MSAFKDFNKKTECQCKESSFERTRTAIKEYMVKKNLTISQVKDTDLREISDNLGFCFRFVLTVFEDIKEDDINKH